jgi:hypothetical protein
MSEKGTIDQYFSPVSSRRSKRPRENTPPEASEVRVTAVAMDDEKVGEMTHGQLANLLGTILDQKLANLATKEDLLGVSNRVQVLEQENIVLRNQVDELKAREKIVADKLVDLEGRSRRNNLIFRGLKLPENTRDYRFHVSKFCQEVFGMTTDVWVNRAHNLDREKRAVIAHFPVDADIEYIMSRLSLLRGTGYSVQRDYPREVREKRAYLMSLRSEIERVCGRRRMQLYYDHLTVEGVKFTWDEGMLKAGRMDGSAKLRDLLKRDFSDFLAELKRQGPIKVRTDPPVSDGKVSTPAPPPAPRVQYDSYAKIAAAASGGAETVRR